MVIDVKILNPVCRDLKIQHLAAQRAAPTTVNHPEWCFTGNRLKSGF